MATSALFQQLENVIRNLDIDAVERAGRLPDSLLLSREGELAMFYAPFDWINKEARVVLVGITSGFTQSIAALRQAQLELRSGESMESALRKAKRTGAFAGPLRKNLVALLDNIGVHRLVNAISCESLFEYRTNDLHTTSVLRFPTFLGSANYNGKPNMLRSPMLKEELVRGLAAEMSHLPRAVFIPLGPAASEAMLWFADRGYVDGRRVLPGLPHPSGSNAERIQYALGLKARSELSAKTNADKLDQSMALLRERIVALYRDGWVTAT